MAKPLRVLNIEDSERDVALLRRHLALSGYALTAERVETSEQMKAALKAHEWDVILCDYSMPQFNALSALKVLKESGLDIPLIIISGTVGEAVAVEAMRTGAQDYLMKDNLVRLEPTIERELQEAENRQAKRQADNERKALSKIIQGSITTSNLDEFLKVVHRAISKIVYAKNCIVMLHDAETDTFTYEFWADEHDPPLSSKPVGTGFGSYVLRTGKPLRLTTQLEKEMIDRGDATLSGTPSLSWVGIPLRTTSNTIGVMVVQHYEVEDAYSERDLEFLSSVGDQIALAIERKRAEEELRESEEKFSGAFELAPIGVALVSPDGKWLKVNKALCELTGYTDRELLKLTFQDITHPDDLRADVSNARRLLKGKLNHYQMEKRYIHKLGHIVFVSVNVSLVHDSKGEPRYFISQIQDITARKLAEAELRESEHLLASSQRITHLGSWVMDIDEDGNKSSERWSDEHYRIFGFEPGQVEITDEVFYNSIHPDDRDRLASTVRESIEQKKNFDIEHRIIRPDGSERTVQAMAEVVLDKKTHKPLKLLGSVQDITDRKRAEDALEQSEERNRELIENAIDIIYTHDLKGNYTSVNKAGEKITGYTTDEALKRNIADSIAPEDVEKAREMISQKLAGNTTTAYEIDLIAKDGRRISFEVNTRIIYENGVPSEVQGIARDVTERKRVNAELKEKSALLEAQLNSSIDGILIVNEHGKQIVQNRQLVDLFKMPQEIADNPDDSAQVKWVTGVLKSPQEFVDRVAYLYANPDEISRDAIELKDGTILDRYSAPVTGKDGKHYGRIWNFRDITEQKKADEALRASNEKFYQLADNITDAFWIRSRDLKEIFYISPAFERIWGRPIETIYEESTEFLKYILPDDREYVEKAYEALTKTAPTIDIEYRIVRPDDEVRWLRTRGFQVRDAKGDLIRLAGVVSDITEQKQTSDALSESEDRYRTLFETSPDGVAMFNLQMEVMVANARSAIIFGYASADEMTGKNAFELIAPENLERAKANINGIFETGYIPPLESIGIRSDGTHFAVEFSATLIRYIDGQPQAILGVSRDITERKRIQEALGESEERYRELVENAIDIIYTLDLEGNYTSINRASEEITGYTVEESLKRNIVESMAPEYREKARELLSAQIHGENLSAFELEILAKDGHRIALEIKTRPIKEDGVAVGVQGIARDITKRKLIEKQIIENEAKFRDLFDNAPVAYHELDVDGCYTRINRTEELMLGYTNEELKGRHVSEFVVERSSRESVKAKLAGKLEYKPHERTFIRKDGTHISVLVGDRLIYDTNGEISGLRTTLQDITERKLAEGLLVESQEQLTLAAESVNLGIWDWDIVEDKLSWDNRMYELYGIRAEDFSGAFDAWQKGLHPDDRKPGDDNIKAALANQRPFSNEFRVVWPNGKVRNIEARAIVKRDMDGKPLRMIGVNWDITDRKELEEQYRQSQKMEAVGVLAGGIAHDFNNLLTAINGFSDLTLQRMEADSPFRDHIQEVKNAGERAAELTGQLLAFSRKQVLKASVISLNSVITNIENMLRRILTENIELRVVLDPKLGNVMADPGQIEQVIMNLAINARDAMPSGGNLTIETENIYLGEGYVNQHLMVSPGEFIRITVSDTGEGMDSTMQSHIFEPFFTTKEVGKGTGLGLATVYGIVKQSGGTIMVYSEIGHGTTFKIYFPRVDQAIERPLWPADSAASHAGTETILLVEDEDTVRGFVVEVLKSGGYHVLAAANGPEALALIKSHEKEIHLLITDVIMPKMGGAELKKRVVELLPEIKVLFISGYTDDSIADRGIDDPDVAFLEKPFSPNNLTQKVRDVLDA